MYPPPPQPQLYCTNLTTPSVQYVPNHPQCGGGAGGERGHHQQGGEQAVLFNAVQHLLEVVGRHFRSAAGPGDILESGHPELGILGTKPSARHYA